jgi:hypothetical protein
MSFGKRAAPPAGDNNSQAPPGSGSTRSDAGGGGDLGVSMERLAPMGLALQKILTSAYTEPNGRAHIETLLAAAAALAGEFALRAVAPPGTLDQNVGWFLGGAPDGLLCADEAADQSPVNFAKIAMTNAFNLPLSPPQRLYRGRIHIAAFPRVGGGRVHRGR